MTQTGQPGPEMRRISSGKELADAETAQGVGMAAADLHERQRTGSVDPHPWISLASNALGQGGIPVFVNISHGSCSSFRKARFSWAVSSFILWMANPAWEIT